MLALSVDEVLLWREYADLLTHEPNPFTGSPALRDDVRFALLASTVSGAFSGKPIDAAKFLDALDRGTGGGPKVAADPQAAWNQFTSNLKAYGEAAKGGR